MKPVGIIGYRSWIAVPLMHRLGQYGAEIDPISKRDAAMIDTRGHECLIIIPGKLGQNEAENIQERELVRSIAVSKNTCERKILLSSLSIAERPDSPYGRHKRLVEDAFFEGEADHRKIAVRPGAIFGPGQDLTAPMLIPQLMREGAATNLKTPDTPTKFVSVNDLAAFIGRLVYGDLMRLCGSVNEIPGTITATPRAIKDLWLTFARP